MNPALDNIVIVDIETVPIVPDYEKLSPRMQEQWDKKSRFFRNEDEMTPAEMFADRGGIYAEFGKIVCIGMGYFTYSGNSPGLRALCLYDEDESKLLTEFNSHLAKFPNDLRLCAHNGKEFDYPYLCRRMLINGLPLPTVLQISGKKPWEIGLVDTMELWKFGDFKSYTSLDLLASIFGIESSKAGIDGSQVSDVFYKEGNLKKIAEYCLRDIVVTAQVYLKLNQMDPIPQDSITLLDL